MLRSLSQAAPVQRVSKRAALISSPLPARRAQPRPLRAATIVSAAAADASTVKIIVQGRHMEVTPPLKEHAQSKVANAIHNFAGIIREVRRRGAARCGGAGLRGAGPLRRRLWPQRTGRAPARTTHGSEWAWRSVAH